MDAGSIECVDCCQERDDGSLVVAGRAGKDPQVIARARRRPRQRRRICGRAASQDRLKRRRRPLGLGGRLAVEMGIEKDRAGNAGTGELGKDARRSSGPCRKSPRRKAPFGKHRDERVGIALDVAHLRCIVWQGEKSSELVNDAALVSEPEFVDLRHQGVGWSSTRRSGEQAQAQGSQGAHPVVPHTSCLIWT